MTGPPIKSVAAQAGYILRVNWSSGSATLLNMKPKLSSPRFSPLREAAVWRSVTTDGYTNDMAEYEVNQFANGL